MSEARLKDKRLRQIFESLKEGRSAPEEVLAARCAHFALESFKASHSSELNQLWRRRQGAAAKIVALGGGSSLDYAAIMETRAKAEALATAIELPEDPVALLPETPGCLLPADAGASKDRLARFLMRRGREDWASATRASSRSAMFDDPLFLGMLRRIAPERAASSLALILMRACLALDEAACQDALRLGADPLMAPAWETEPHKERPMPTNVLGALLAREATNPLPMGQGLRAHAPSLGDDGHLHAAAKRAIACCAPEQLGRLLSLAPPRAKVLPERDAIGLSFALGLHRCSRMFLEMGMDLGAPSAGAPVSFAESPTFHRVRIQAFAKLRADAERAGIETAVDPPAPADGPEPARPRL